MKIFLDLGWYFKAQWRRYMGAVLMLLSVDVLELLIPWLTGRLIDQIIAQTLVRDVLLRYVGIVVVLALTIYVLRFFWRYFLFSSSFQLAELMRQRIYRHLTMMSPEFFQRHRTGDLMARATNDISAVEMTAGEGVLSGVDGLVTGLLVLAMMMLVINWQLTLVALLPFPVMAFMIIGDRLHDGFVSAQERFSDLNDRVQESISGIRMIRAFGREQHEDSDFLKIADEAAEANMGVAATDSLYDPAILLTVGASFLLSMSMGAWLVQQGELSLGQLTSFTMYLGFLVWPMFAYGWLLNIVERGKAAYARINQLLQTPSPVADTGLKTECLNFDVAMHVSNFSYPDRNAAPAVMNSATAVIATSAAVQNNASTVLNSAAAALKNVNVVLPAGEMLGIVGATGAGKTTLANLLLRYYDHPDCDVRIGGTPVQEFTLEFLRSLVAVVPQDPFLFTATIAENIAMGRPDASFDEVQAVARLAAVDHDILRFPDGYHTLVGERGITLSGGQKQRIAIARALLIEAPILILDDALSAVDANTEKNILGHLNEIRAGKTTLVLCHRLSAVEHAQQIIVLSHGDLIEQGTHQQLLEHKGWYARMIDYQKLEQTVESGR
jgi:ATP-binding cassette, subfamily B, multidrug efflux pump